MDHIWDVDLVSLTYIHTDNLQFQVPLIHQDGETLEQLISKANTELGTKIIEYEIEKYKSTRPNVTFDRFQLIKKFNKNVTFKDKNDKVIFKNKITIVQYKNATTYQYVGDTLEPLLRNVAFPTMTNSNKCLISDSPYYVSDNKSYINTIFYKLKDFRKSLVKLHFRPLNGL